MARWLTSWWLPAQPSVELRQRYIFIVPTLAGYAFVVALVLMILVAINYQNSLAYGLTFILASMGLLTILHTWRNLVGLRLQALNTEPCFAGGNARFVIRLDAQKHERQALAMGWLQSKLVLIDVPQSGNQLELELPAPQRGYLRAPRLRVETRYPLGIWVAWSQLELAQSVLVYPKPVEAELDSSAGLQNGELTQGGGSGMRGVDDYQGLENWQLGDSLRRINWKAWSKGQGLWVKHFVETQGTQTQLDFSALNGDVEYRLSVLCAQVLRLTRQELPFSLRLPKQTLGPNTGLAHQTECLRALALYGKADHD